MSESDSYLAEELDPYEWSQVLDDTSSAASRFIFQRAIEVTLELSQAILQNNQRWLDVGCGTGHLAQRLCAAGADVNGVDRDLAMLKFARHRWLRASADRELSWIRASAEHLPFGDATIDGLVATSLTGYMPNPRDFLKEVYRVLRSEGHAIITFTNRMSWLLKMNYFATRRTGNSSSSELSLHLHQMATVMNELRDLGFIVRQVRFYNFVLHVGRWLLPPSPIAKALERLGSYRFSHRMGRNFVVVARKAIQ